MAIRAFLAVLLVFAVAFAANSSQSGCNDTIRIIGGVDAEEGEFPYLASLQMRTRKGLQHFCGGSLLDATTVLTAGHCVRAASRYRVADVRVRIGSLVCDYPYASTYET
jgi:trypsin